jgi:hypothetical protein
MAESQPQAVVAPPADTAAGPHPIDVQRLADKVYNLLLADARVARARGDSPLVHQRHGEG